MTMRLDACVGYIFSLALGLFLVSGCSKPAEPVVTPSAEKTEPMPAKVETAEELLPLETEDKTVSLYREYVKQLKAGDLIQASANLSTLNSQLKGDDLSDPFWKDQIPEDHRLILMVGALCSSCTDGSCATCKGRRSCPTCAGTGLCKSCEGKGGEWLACQSCICKACGGARFCQECRGRRVVNCPTCNGSGNGREEQRFEACSSCGGRGYKDGLKGPNGTSKIKCLRCNGSKGVYTTIHSPCPACDGSGRKNCSACNGTGACAACRGLGRTGDCQICSGQGRYLNPCKVCGGGKKCLDCDGTTLCKTCKGRGSCVDCNGRNLVIRYRMPIDRRWLVQPDARIIQPGPEGLVKIPLTGTAATLQLNGRTITADVSAGNLLWASSPEDLGQISGLFIP
jgi:hypothetical protein